MNAMAERQTSGQVVRVGMIGAGFFGQVAHLCNYARMANCRVEALAELRDDLRQKVGDRYAIGQRFGSHHDLLAHADVDAVVVVTARAAMGPIVLDCLAAGKHVLSEKPIAGSSELAAKLNETARAKGTHFWIGYMKRHDAGVKSAKELVDRLIGTGELGEMTYARLHCFGGDAYCGEKDYETSDTPVPSGLARWPIAPDWIPAEEHRSFDRYLNTFCHDLNLLRYFLGPPCLQTAFQDGDRGLALFHCGGIPVVLETGFLEHSGWDESLRIYFRRGWIKIDLPAPLLRNSPAQVHVYRGGSGGQLERIQIPPSWSFQRQAEEFIEAVRLHRPLTRFSEEAQLDVELAERIWRLATQRQEKGGG